MNQGLAPPTEARLDDADRTAQHLARLERLMGFVKRDPANLTLLADAANEAFEAGRAQDTAELLDRYAALAELPPPLLNLRGLARLRLEAFDGAVEDLSSAAATSGEPAVRFHLAVALMRQQRFDEALVSLDDAAIDASPAGPRLRVRALRGLERLDLAVTEGLTLIQRYPADRALKGAVAMVAIDDDQVDLAAELAHAAQGTEEGALAGGLVSLAQGEPVLALERLRLAAAFSPGSLRVNQGLGLALLLTGDARQAAPALEAAATGWGDDAPAWTLAGWAQLALGDVTAARERFRRAADLDPEDAEATGALAVIEAMQGGAKSASDLADAALAIDPECLTALLARTMLKDPRAADQLKAALESLDAAGSPAVEGLMERMVGALRKSGRRDG